LHSDKGLNRRCELAFLRSNAFTIYLSTIKIQCSRRAELTSCFIKALYFPEIVLAFNEFFTFDDEMYGTTRPLKSSVCVTTPAISFVDSFLENASQSIQNNVSQKPNCMSLDFISLETIQEIAQQYGYWAVFLGILLENLGLPIPGETVTLAGGFLAGNDQLNYWIVLADAASGAFLGGNIGYWIGRRGGWPLLLRVGRIFRIQDDRLESLKRQFSENAAKTVFLGRFIALLRTFASPLAGIVQMPFLTFTIYNTLGAITWASVMVSLSYFAGQVVPLEKLVAWAGQFAFVMLLIAIAWIVVPFWLESRKVKEIINDVQPDDQPIGEP